MNPIIASLVAVTLFAVLCGYPAMKLAVKFNLIDVPGSAVHKTHRSPMPLAGGMLIVLTILMHLFVSRSRVNTDILAMLMSSTVVFLFGIWDDRMGLSALPKLLGQFIAAALLISLGVQVHFVDVFYDAGHVSWFVAQAANVLITFFWLIGITNAVNMIDSMDGIVAGIGMIASLCYLYATNAANQEIVSVWSAVLFGICAGLYLWNKVLGKFFLGDSGAQTVGFLLATLGILYNPRGLHPESSWFLPIMLLGIPIFDTTLVVISRLKRKQPIGTGRRDHTYHRLIALGFSSKFAVLTTHLAALLVSGLAFFTFFLPAGPAMIIFFSTLFVGIMILIWLEKKPTLDRELVERNNET